ncbi:MAG TPA: hypothetical protein VM261_39405 [Kofleriaceae bacterium]|nr:hypothetical protein [Kofleriaceae bacterium]
MNGKLFPDGELCRRMGQQLEMHASTIEIPGVLEAWAGDVPSGELTLPQRRAHERVSEWRAMMDYARELVPVCTSPKARASCDALTKDASTAPPSALLKNIATVGKAFQSGTECRP